MLLDSQTVKEHSKQTKSISSKIKGKSNYFLIFEKVWNTNKCNIWLKSNCAIEANFFQFVLKNNGKSNKHNIYWAISRF